MSGGVTPLESMLAEELADTIEQARSERREQRHCAFCGAPSWGYACRAHAYLAVIEKRARGEAA